ncbi:MAG: pyridoxine 5'-phosphate synthase [bacterium]
MPKLGVNIDHIATLRQQRMIGEPDLIKAANIIIKSGADSITMHLREDRRHIQDRDVFALRNMPGLFINLEMAASKEILNIALNLKPNSVCIVPEKRKELTTEGGLDVVNNKNVLERYIKLLKNKWIFVSLFVDPLEKQIKAAYDIGADAVEIHTGSFANAEGKEVKQREFQKVLRASQLALKLGLKLHAGHGLDYFNVKPIASINGMRELNIGFSIISRSIFVGLERAVREMKRLIVIKRSNKKVNTVKKNLAKKPDV